eukprot:TRINITY_DN27588_c0_g1_i1.p2 TRINITY_DN27588_c0_g1~~TRINITY_DN27588_c0_g1_i1.p2  ORF type:complete len:459 (+),score=174.06 TRINITY_DN27588_c0_g1_i1:74-1378(+)
MAAPAVVAPSEETRRAEWRGEVRKLQDCMGVDEETAWRRLSACVDARSDRHYMADMVVLKEANAQLRRKVDELKVQAHDQTQKYMKLRDLLNVRSNEAKEVKKAVANAAFEREQRLKAEAQVALLQQQLRDLLHQNDEERVASCRLAENLVYPLPCIPTSVHPTAAGTAAASCVALLGAVASLHCESASAVLLFVPDLVAAAVAVAAGAAATTNPVRPPTTDRGCSTDVSMTQYLYYPAVDELPRGQELLRALRDREAELAVLRRTAPDAHRYKRVVDKLNRLLEEKKKSLVEYQQRTEEWKEVQESKLKAVEQYNQTLRGMYISASEEVVKARGLKALAPDAARDAAAQTTALTSGGAELIHTASQCTPQASKPIAIPRGPGLTVGHPESGPRGASHPESVESAPKGSYQSGGDGSCVDGVFIEEESSEPTVT